MASRSDGCHTDTRRLHPEKIIHPARGSRGTPTTRDARTPPSAIAHPTGPDEQASTGPAPIGNNQSNQSSTHPPDAVDT